MRSRGFVWTWNNYTDKDVLFVRNFAKKCRYLVFGYEIGPKCGTPHLQGYMYFDNARSVVALRKAFPSGFVEVAKTVDAALNYCKEDGKIEEFGKRPEQGERVDLKEVIAQIGDGLRTDDICLSNPMLYHMYGRTLKKAEELRLRKQFRNWMTTGVWYFGETGTGKSHRAFKDFNPDTHYVVNLNDNGFWNGYVGQEVIILNDFRGQLAYDEILRLCDKWPHSVKIKGESPFPFLGKKVIVTSSLPPEKVYNRRDGEDKIAQLYRRFEVFFLKDIDTEVVWGNNKAQTDYSDDPFGLNG